MTIQSWTTPTTENTNAELQNFWNCLQTAAREALGESAYKHWIAPLNIGSIENGTLELLAPTRFFREWVRNHYEKTLLDIAKSKQSNIVRITFRHQPNSNESSQEKNISRNPNFPAIASGVALPNNGNIVPMQAYRDPANNPVTQELDRLSLDPRYQFSNFAVGKENQLAFAACNAIASQRPISSRLITIHGGVGQGKTHLLQSIAAHVRENSANLRVLYLAAETFMYHFIQSVQRREMNDFKACLRSADILIIDDISFIAGKEGTQEELLHTIKNYIEQGKYCVLASSRNPLEISTLDARLRSYIQGGLCIEIERAGATLRENILKKKLAMLPEVKIPENLIEKLATQIDSNVRELEGALHKIIARSSLLGQEITEVECNAVLSEQLGTRQTESHSIDHIIENICAHFQIKRSDILSARRLRQITKARHIIMYASKQLTNLSLTDIGRMLGGKDHSTVLHAIRKLEKEKKEYPALEKEIQIIFNKLR